MDLAYLHIVTNHVPIIGIPVALFFLGFGILRKNDDLKTASFVVFAFLGILTVATFLAGQGGEDFVEEISGVSHDSIHEHEDFAKFALAGVSITAILSLFALLRYQGLAIFRRRVTAPDKFIEGEIGSGSFAYYPKWVASLVLVLALISAGLLGYTGKLGGKIRHTEFYGNAVDTDENHADENKDKDKESKTIAQPNSLDPKNPESPEKSGKKRRGRDDKE